MRQPELKIYPDPCLRIKTKPVEVFTDELKDTLRSMADVMNASEGIGLAGTQIGLGLSILVVDVGEGLLKLVNPEICERSRKKFKMQEGCLSLPGLLVTISRPEHIKVRAQNENGEFFVKKFDGLTAIAIQHEMDHLQGKLIMDYLDPFRRFMASRKLAGVKRSKKAHRTCEVKCK